jgi:glucose uptake protein
MLPVTHGSVLLLLIAALVCLGCWINTFKAVVGRWRFELFAVDFAFGALALALIAAYTVGAMGSDLGFADRILVAGRTAQALAVISGAVFNLGAMLLLASVSLLGISTAIPFTLAVALVVNSCFHFGPKNFLYLIAGVLVMIAVLMFELRAARLREAALQAKREADVPVTVGNTAAKSPKANRPVAPAATAAPKRKMSRKAVRGIIVAAIAGVPLALFVPILENCIPGDLGLGGYAGMVLFALGMLGSTIVYNFYFLNITVEGPPTTFAAFFRGRAGNHGMGIVGGAICMAGLLAAALALTAPPSADAQPILHMLLPLLSVPLAVTFGIFIWKELSVPGKSKVAVIAGVLLWVCGLGLLSFGFTH